MSYLNRAVKDTVSFFASYQLISPEMLYLSYFTSVIRSSMSEDCH